MSLNDRERIALDLEFLQNLSNAGYLHYLAQHKYFEKESFMNYLRYLQYWKKPEYLARVRFPHCLAFLDAILEDKEFRTALGAEGFRDFVHQQQAAHWLHYCDETSQL